MNVDDAISQCLKDFPELLECYDAEELSGAISLGGYIFFEDYFNEFVADRDSDVGMLQRVGAFIEKMAGSSDVSTLDLTQIGILEGLVNRRVYGVAEFLGAGSRSLLANAARRTRIEKDVWLLKRRPAL